MYSIQYYNTVYIPVRNNLQTVKILLFFVLQWLMSFGGNNVFAESFNLKISTRNAWALAEAIANVIDATTNNYVNISIAI